MRIKKDTVKACSSILRKKKHTVSVCFLILPLTKSALRKHSFVILRSMYFILVLKFWIMPHCWVKHPFVTLCFQDISRISDRGGKTNVEKNIRKSRIATLSDAISQLTGGA